MEEDKAKMEINHEADEDNHHHDTPQDDNKKEESQSTTAQVDEVGGAGAVVVAGCDCENKIQVSEANTTIKKEKPPRTVCKTLSMQSVSSTTTNKSSKTSTSVGKLNKKMSDASMISASEHLKNSEPVRLSGYLEKRSKMLGWKKFWCVLDGRLLTYYKSKSDYESLSACCGSINLGIASTVRPIQIRGCKGYPLQIVTRTQVYYLRSLDKTLLDHWLISIQEAASSQPRIAYPAWTDPGSHCIENSFTALSQWSLSNSTDDINESLNHRPQKFYLKNDRALPIIQKCHSFAALTSPTVNYPDSKMSNKDSINNNICSIRRRDINTSEHDPPFGTKVRHSTSMLLLESSPQASDLKRELTRKLSMGSSVSAKTKQFEKFKDVPISDNKSEKEDPDDESHHYDEILDFEGMYENYEPCGSKGDSDETLVKSDFGNNVDNDIYENVENLDDPWEKMEAKKVDLKFTEKRNSGQSQHRLSSGSNRNSLVSISEVPEDALSNKPKNLTSIPEYKTQWKNVSFKSTTNSEEELSSNSSSLQNLSYNSDKPGKKWKALGGFFHKIFHKEKIKKLKEKGPKDASAMVITGPVDLKSRYQQQQENQNRPTNLPIKSQSFAHHKHSPPVGSKLTINSENVMDELKRKVGTMKRIDSDSSGFSSKCSLSSTPTADVKDFTPKTEKCLPIFGAKESQEVSTVTSEIPSKPGSTSEAIDTINNEADDSVPVLRQRNHEEFQQKLARFNRLSQKLSSSFAAALNPLPANPSFGVIGRSNSCRIQKNIGDDICPPLPPKKKNCPDQNERPIYDTPQNNRPVTKQEFELLDPPVPTGTENTASNFLRGLVKKTSAPDIMFSGSRSSGNSGDESLLRDSLETKDEVFEDILISVPPPRPPKPVDKSDSVPEVEPTTLTDSLPSVFQSEVDVPQLNPKKMESVTEEEIEKFEISNLLTVEVKSSPTASNKSVDIDNLEVLSDMSDMNVINSPPDSPGFSPKEALTNDFTFEVEDEINSYQPTIQELLVDVTDGPLILQEILESPEETLNSSAVDIEKSEENDDSESHANLETECIYENLKFATINMLVQELETVEENEDEMSELYDDFPSEFTNPLPLPCTATAGLPACERKPLIDSIRHSGIDQLQAFLNMDMHNSENLEKAEVPVFTSTSPSIMRMGAVSRLGHSSAVNQLQRIAENNN